MNDLTTLFCSVDDFWISFESEWSKRLTGSGKPRTGPEPELSMSEMMTIVILFHQSNFRTFKHFYSLVSQELKNFLVTRVTPGEFLPGVVF